MEGTGPIVMLVLCVDNWDTHLMVFLISAWHYYSLSGVIMIYLIVGASAHSGHSNSREAWPYIISAVNCNGSEAQILDCVYNTHLAECGQAEAAYVHCQPGR